MPETKQMNDCLKRVNDKLKKLKEQKEDIKCKMEVEDKIVKSIKIQDENTPEENWKNTWDISKHNNKFNNYYRDLQLVQTKINLLNEILSGTKCWNVQCC